MKKNRATIGFLFILFMVYFYIYAELSHRPDRTFFEQRRQALMDKMEGGIAILSSPKRSTRGSDIYYLYRQDSNFFYLTGLEEPESVVMLIPDAKKKFVSAGKVTSEITIVNIRTKAIVIGFLFFIRSYIYFFSFLIFFHIEKKVASFVR